MPAAFATASAIALSFSRSRIETLIEQLIAALDFFDGDCDHEQDADIEIDALDLPDADTSPEMWMRPSLPGETI